MIDATPSHLQSHSQHVVLMDRLLHGVFVVVVIHLPTQRGQTQHYIRIGIGVGCSIHDGSELAGGRVVGGRGNRLCLRRCDSRLIARRHLGVERRVSSGGSGGLDDAGTLLRAIVLLS